MSWAIKAGDARAVLAGEAAGSVQTVCTSPPYWGAVRSYGTAPQLWGGAVDCDHAWIISTRKGQTGGPCVLPGAGRSMTEARYTPDTTHATCSRCGAWRGEIGHEPTVEAYCAHLVEVFAAVARVLRPDGTVFLNLGDKMIDGQLVGVPWMVAFALKAAGWRICNELIWHKTACLPESVTRRWTRAHEQIFVLARRADYYMDMQAVAEPSTGQQGTAANFARATKEDLVPGQAHVQHRVAREATADTGTRNPRDVWPLGPAGSDLPHYAMFPPEIPRRAILAGTSAAGCCAACGAPYRRLVEREVVPVRPNFDGRKGTLPKSSEREITGGGPIDRAGNSVVTTTGWAPGCECGAAVVPCKVLDPFSGAGTTGQEALRLGRDFLGIELLPANVELSRRRIQDDCPLFNTPGEIAV